MGDFFTDTMLGLLQAVSIEKGNIPVEEVKNMPAKTFRAVNSSSENVLLASTSLTTTEPK